MGWESLLPIAGAIGGAFAGGAPGAGVGANLGGGLAASIGQGNTNAQNWEIASQQMAFQREMSNTAHAREVADLKKAGLNPILSANSGASTPSGASTTMSNPDTPIQQGVQNAVQSALAAKAQINQDKQVDNQLKNDQLNRNLTAAQIQNASNSARRSAAEAEQAEMDRDATKAAQPAKMKIAPYLPWIDLGKEGLGAVHDAADLYLKAKGVNILKQGKMPGYLENSKDGIINKNTGEIYNKR